MAEAEPAPEPEGEAAEGAESDAVLTPFYTVSAGGDGLTTVRAGWQDPESGEVEVLRMTVTVGPSQAASAVELARQWHLAQLNRAAQSEEAEADG